MCESTVLIKKGAKKEIVMPDVARIIVEGVCITLWDILGERKELAGFRLTEANLMDHEIILEEI